MNDEQKPDEELETALAAARERGRIKVAAMVKEPILSKVETTARVGRMYYQALNDAAGYPNGMAYWPEMPPKYKYSETLTALDFIRTLAEQGLITINVPMGTPDLDMQT